LVAFFSSCAAAALALAVGCGTAADSGVGGEVGTYQPLDGGASLQAADAGGGQIALAVSATATLATVCPGQCVGLAAQASGGTAPYVYSWDEAGPSDGGAVRVCPAATTTYVVTATDSLGSSAEVHASARTGTASVTVTVDAATCGDAALDAHTDAPPEACDSVARDFSPQGVNPSGPWSYGESAGLGGSFVRFDTFVHDQWDPDAGGPIAGWQLGLVNTPSVGFDDQATGETYGVCPIAPGQFGLGADPIFMKYPIARWTAPSAGRYSVRATFVGLCGTGGVPPTVADVHIQHDSADIRSGYLNVNGGGNSATYAVDVDVVAGDTIDFVVGGGGQASTTINWMTGLDALVCHPTGGG
jgi:hypothetical protein